MRQQSSKQNALSSASKLKRIGITQTLASQPAFYTADLLSSTAKMYTGQATVHVLRYD